MVSKSVSLALILYWDPDLCKTWIFFEFYIQHAQNWMVHFFCFSHSPTHHLQYLFPLPILSILGNSNNLHLILKPESWVLLMTFSSLSYPLSNNQRGNTGLLLGYFSSLLPVPKAIAPMWWRPSPVLAYMRVKVLSS